MNLNQMIILFLIISFLCRLRYVLIIRIIYFYNKNKMTTSIFMPSFITNWIKDYKDIANRDDEYLKKIIDFYYFHMYIYIFMFLMLLLTLFREG